MTAATVSRTSLLAILIATTAALVARSWLQIRLTNAGMTTQTAADLSYLVVPAILLIILFPLWPRERQFLGDRFRCSDLGAALVWRAIAIGVLLRILWWCQLLIGISLGLYQAADPDAITGPAFSFQCASPESVLLGLVVMALLVPVIEEIIYRGYVQTAVSRYGAVIAVIASAFIFAVFHRTGGMLYAMFAGVVLGAQYWRSQSLWPSLISHVTINGLILLDWRCLSGQWNPRPADVPIVLPAIVAISVALLSIGLLIMLLRRTTTGASPPR